MGLETQHGTGTSGIYQAENFLLFARRLAEPQYYPAQERIELDKFPVAPYSKYSFQPNDLYKDNH